MTPPAHHDEFLALVEDHKKILHKVANSYCGNPADRPDLIQEIVLQLWRSFHRFDDSYRFSTWMYRVALNVAISSYRRERLRTSNTVVVEESALEVAAAERATVGDRDDVRLLYDLIHRLDEMNRALVLLYLEGYSHAGISEILGISESNSATKINRIKQELRRVFDRLGVPNERGAER